MKCEKVCVRTERIFDGDGDSDGDGVGAAASGATSRQSVCQHISPLLITFCSCYFSDKTTNYLDFRWTLFHLFVNLFGM